MTMFAKEVSAVVSKLKRVGVLALGRSLAGKLILKQA